VSFGRLIVDFQNFRGDRLRVSYRLGGSPPKSFKGFVNCSTTAPASCGAMWATDPGNSSNPSATVPAYIAVIDSSSISQSGSTISGDTPKVVIVKTNPGYNPNQGSAGTGTVVGVLCQ
jgi:hypothetical protein